METRLKKLFDYQRFEGNERLSKICGAVESKYANAQELTDDELYMVAAGKNLDNQMPSTEGKIKNKTNL